MGRIAAHSQEQVFEAADKLAAEGHDVTPTTLRELLGRGSFSTLGKHIDAWQQARKTAPAPVMIEMPEGVKVAFAQCWMAAAAEAGKEIAAIREKADAEVHGTKRRLDEALAEVERLEEYANADATALDAAQARLAQTVKDAQQAATAAAAREAALSATAVQMQKQIEAQQAEILRIRTEAAEKLDAAVARERAKIEEATKAKADAERLTDQLAEQKARSAESIGNLETALSASRQEAKTLADNQARAQGELEALRTQLARLNDTLRSLAPMGEKKGKGSAA